MNASPIVICTLGSPSLGVLKASVQAYAPSANAIVFVNERSTFGQAYNAALQHAFQDHDAAIIANDDCVLTPFTMSLLMEDVAALKSIHGDMLGLVTCMADDSRSLQDIRYRPLPEHPERAARVSPIFAWISRAAFERVQFPPLNWYSDDVLCEDLNALGFKHYISRAYVHHAGSQTVGRNHRQLNAEAMPWLTVNRPEYCRKWFNHHQR